MKYVKKPIPIEAVQWFKLGDHPEVVDVHPTYSDFIPVKNGATGYIDTLEGGHFVTAGDWIIQGVAGEFYPCKPDIFEKTYVIYDEKRIINAIRELTSALKEDEGYWMSWQANIAMAFVDEYRRNPKKYKNYKDIHGIANQAAINFLKLLMRD